jgi:hypothetical protein
MGVSVPITSAAPAARTPSPRLRARAALEGRRVSQAASKTTEPGAKRLAAMTCQETRSPPAKTSAASPAPLSRAVWPAMWTTSAFGAAEANEAKVDSRGVTVLA